jgi:hypothetical protein
VSAAAVAYVGLLLVAPGLGAVLAVFPPKSISFPSALTLVLGFGYAVTALSATLLAVFGVIGAVTFPVAVGVATVVLWGLAIRRHGLRARVSAWREAARADPVPTALGLAVILLYAGIRYHRFSPFLDYDIAAASRYWADGLIIAHAGHIPALTHGWGTAYPTTVSKVVLNSFVAGVSYRLAPLTGMAAVLWISAVGLYTGLWALARELGLRVAAPLLPVLLIAVPSLLPLNPEMTRDLDVFTGENLGRMVAVAAFIAGIQAVRTRHRATTAAAAVTLMAAAGTHLIPTAVVAGLLIVYAVVYGLSIHGVRRALLTAAIIAGVAVAGWGALVAGSNGGLGFQRVGGSGSVTGFPAFYDPARSFQLARPIFVPGRARHAYYFLPRTILYEDISTTLGSTAHKPGWKAYALLAVAFAAAVALVVLRRFELVWIGAMAIALAAAILVAALAFDYRYSTVVPADFGPVRLYDYNALPLVLVACGVLEVCGRLIARLDRRAVYVLQTVVLVAAVAAVWNVRPMRSTATATTAGQLFATVRADVPCNARILTDARTAGAFAALTGRQSIVEGMAPYLNPAVLHRVLPVLFGARTFFTAPAAHADFLRSEHVDYVLLVKGRKVTIGQTGRLGRRVDYAGVRALPMLHLVARRPAFELYSVGPPASPPPGGFTGRCTAATS